MYSANLEDQLFSEALPLKPIFPRCGSAETVTVAVPQVPVTSGLGIDTVTVELTLPDGSVVSANAVNKANTPLWSATFPASAFAVSGRVEGGLKVSLGGTDERGATRVWIVSRGDLEVRSDDAAPSPGGSYVIVKLRSSAPATPVDGDAYISAGALYIYQAGAWIEIGGNSGPDNSKLDGAAAYPAWDATRAYFEEIVSYNGRLWYADGTAGAGLAPPDEPWIEKKISELKQDALSPAQIGYINDVPNKADKAVPSAAGNLAALDAQGNLADSGAKPSAFAAKEDLPYRLVTPGKWTFAPYPDGVTSVEILEYNSVEGWGISVNGDAPVYAGLDEPNALELEWDVYGDGTRIITAMRASLPGHLVDRRSNKITASSATTLTHPSALGGGRLRDFLVRLTIPSGTTLAGLITFADPSGETITYETDGDEFPVPDDVGKWLYAFTETDDGVFDVSLKKVNTVAQGGAQ